MQVRQAGGWEQVVSFANLLEAFRKAARGKRSRPDVASFAFRLEPELLSLQEELQAGSYRPGPYRRFVIQEGKRRVISAAPFRDRVVHHALMNVIQPGLERSMIFDSYANRVGKGSHKAVDRCTHYLRRFRYVLPLDVREFFPSIDHAILLHSLGKKLHDERVLELCRHILEGGAEELRGEYTPVYFAGDDLFAINRPRGLPIGNLTSQLWANVYLDGLDQRIKRSLRCKGYVRYVDDMLLFADSKQDLHAWLVAVRGWLADLRLTLHEHCAQPRPSHIGVPFLGFQVFPDHRKLRRRNVVQARRRLQHLAADVRAGRVPREKLEAGVRGWVNHARYGDTWGLRRSILEDVIL